MLRALLRRPTSLRLPMAMASTAVPQRMMSEEGTWSKRTKQSNPREGRRRPRKVNAESKWWDSRRKRQQQDEEQKKVEKVGPAAASKLVASLQEALPTSAIGERRDEFLPDESFFGSAHSVTIDKLFRANVHWGHPPGAWHRSMEPFLFGIRADMHVIDLEQTLSALRRALNVARHVAYSGGTILFVNNRKEFSHITRTAAEKAGEYFVVNKWIGGTLTNRIEVVRTARLPDLLICTSAKKLIPCLREAFLTGVPTIAICDSDCDPNIVDYAVPGNDDSESALVLYYELFARAINEGKERKRLNLPLGL